MPQKPTATFELPFSTGANVQDATTYKGYIDAAIMILARLGSRFNAHANSTPDMRVYLDPGHVFDGTTLTEVGAFTVGNTNSNTTVNITGGVAGISGTMLVSGPGIPANTTGTISGSTVTLSQASTATATGVPLKFMQRSGVITAPGSNSRIDRVVVDRTTGAVSIITGTPGATPAIPVITGSVCPVAQILLTSATTAITNNMISDERNLGLLGLTGTLPWAALSVAQTFTGAQKVNATALTSSSNHIATDLSVNNNFTHTFTESTTLDNPSNIVAGQSGCIFLTQHASSPKTLAFGSNWKSSQGNVPAVSAVNSAQDTLYYNVRDSTHIEYSLVLANS